MMGGLTLSFVWGIRCRFRAEGAKLWAEGAKLRAEGAKLWAEGAKLWAEGAKLWAEAVIAAHGNITMHWLYRGKKIDCELGTGEVFREEDA